MQRKNREWIKNQFPYLEAVTTGSYVNFPYGKLPDYLEEYYGGHAKALSQIKSKYDPMNIFTFPQGIKEKGHHSHPITTISDLLDKEDEGIMNQSDDMGYRGFRYVSK